MRDQNTAFILCATLLLLFLGDAAAQTSRTDSAKSYVERRNSWLKKERLSAPSLASTAPSLFMREWPPPISTAGCLAAEGG
jgi:hypothetical protein